MRTVLAVAQRELAIAFAKPRTWLLLGAFSILASWATFGPGAFFALGEASLDTFWDGLPLLLALLAPSLAAESWAGEDRLGTVELLLAAPATPGRLVLGKFLAAWGLCALAFLLPMASLWLAVAWLGAPDHGRILAGLLGALLLSAPQVALGTWLSALTRHRGAAFLLAVLGAGLLVAPGRLPPLAGLTEELPPLARDGLSRLGLQGPFQDAAAGLLDLRELLLFPVLTLLFLFWNTLAVAGRRGGRLREGMLRRLQGVLLLGLTLEALLLADAWLPRWRLDLTAAREHTLAPGTVRLLARLEEPVAATLWSSAGPAGSARARERAHADRVRRLLREYKRASGGRLSFREVHPEPFSQEAERALRLGLESRPVRPLGSPFFLGLTLANSVDQREVLPWLDPAQAGRLEYDLGRRILALTRLERPRLGVLSPLPLAGDAGPVGGGRGGRWLFLDALAGRFQVRILPADAPGLPEDLDVILVVQPRDLGEGVRQALDRWIRSGRPAVVCVDPWCEHDQGRGSDLPDLLRAWGLRLVPGQVVADRELALRAAGRPAGAPAAPGNPLRLRLRPGQMDAGDPVTGGVGSLVLSTPGALEPTGGAGRLGSALLLSSRDSRLVPDSQVALLLREPAALGRGFVPDPVAHTLAVRVRGRPLVVIADVDFLHEIAWARLQERGMVRQLVGTSAGNMAFLENLLEDLAGAEVLAAIPLRRDLRRPLRRLEDLAPPADDARARALHARLREVEARLAGFAIGGGDDGVRPGPRERQLRTEALVERIRLRRELDALHAGSRQAVRALERRVELVVYGGAPVFLAAVGLATFLVRSWRRSPATRGGES